MGRRTAAFSVVVLVNAVPEIHASWRRQCAGALETRKWRGMFNGDGGDGDEGATDQERAGVDGGAAKAGSDAEECWVGDAGVR